MSTWIRLGEVPLPKDRRFLASVDGCVRILRWGKTSHVPIYGFCYADQGAEDFDLIDDRDTVTHWMEMPAAPAERPNAVLKPAPESTAGINPNGEGSES